MTGEGWREGTTEDHRLSRVMEQRLGARVSFVVWDDPDVEWDRLDHLVVRSCWDYHVKSDAWRRWVDARRTGEARLHNSARLVDWNTDKRYLLELADRGLPVVPTRVLDRWDPAQAARLASAAGWDEVVVKPTISLTSYRTLRLTRDALEANQVAADHYGDASVLVQPFRTEILEGEWSLVFLGGRYSHSVFKSPAAGDFRVQSDFGGTVAERTAPSGALDAAVAILASVPSTTYARVDGVMTGEGFQLMELELIDPVLFNGTDELAERFARAILAE